MLDKQPNWTLTGPHNLASHPRIGKKRGEKITTHFYVLSENLINFIPTSPHTRTPHTSSLLPAMSLIATLTDAFKQISTVQLCVILYLVYMLTKHFFTAAAEPEDPSKPSAVRRVVGVDELASLRAGKPKQLVVVDFHAGWCGPCVAVAPFVESLAKANPVVLFLKVKEEENKEVMAAESISCYPTFRFYTDGRCIKQVLGGNMEVLRASVLELSKSIAKGEALPEVDLSASSASSGGSGCTVC
jgi:thioredoxin 1